MPVDYFNVLDSNGNVVAAKTLVDASGNTVMNPNTALPLIVPANYDPTAAIAAGQGIAARRDAIMSVGDPNSTAAAQMFVATEMARLFMQGGNQDLQRSYNTTVDGSFVGSFTAAASYNLGLIGAAAGIDLTTIQAGGGIYNTVQWIKSLLPGFSRIDVSGLFNNNPNNLS